MAESPSELQFEIEKLERKHAEHPEGRFFVPLANAYRKMGDVETAEALLRSGVQKHPDYLSAHIVLGRCLADRGAVSEAEDEFRFVLSQDPQNLIALRTLGELAVSEGRTGEAVEWYRELLAVDPMNEDARQALDALSDAPASPEAETEFRSGAGWWQAEPEAGAAPEPTPDVAAPSDQWAGYGELPELRDEPAEDSPEWPQAERKEESQDATWFQPEEQRYERSGGASWRPADEPVQDDRSGWLEPAASGDSDDSWSQADGSGAHEAGAAGETWYQPEPEPLAPLEDAAAREPSTGYTADAEDVLPVAAAGEAAAEPGPDALAPAGDAAVSEVPRADLREEPVAVTGVRSSSFDDAEEDPAYEEEGPRHSEVVTETIAELYARQGLHDRAISVYRELIRRRGGDAGLEQRIADIERQQRVEQGTGFEPGTAFAAEEPEYAPEPAAPDLQESLPEPDLPAAPADTEPDDAFAASFAGGFDGAFEEEVVEEAAALPSLEAAPEVIPSAGDRVTIARFLADLVAWTPSSAGATAAPPAPAPATAREPEAPAEAGLESATHGFVEEESSAGEMELPVWGETSSFGAAAGMEETLEDDAAADEGSLPYLETVPGTPEPYGTGSAEDEEPFPWELPGDTTYAEEPAAAETEPDSIDSYFAADPGSEREQDAESEPARVEYRPEPLPEIVPPPPPADRPDASPASGGKGPQDDEDLESFQAWLRSLKR